jgi:hypothetical protein
MLQFAVFEAQRAFLVLRNPHPKIDVDYVLDLYTLYSCLLCWNIQLKVILLIGIGSGFLVVVV